MSPPTSPSISNIPLEILLNIFESLVKLERFPSVQVNGPFRLMGVCTAWKEIVQASPNLWAHITILHHTDTFQKMKARLRTCLFLSKNWPLTITMLSISPLLQDLAIHSERWKTIYMVVDRLALGLLHTLPLPILEKATLVLTNSRVEDVFDHPIHIDLQRATSLGHAAIAIRSYATINGHRPRLFLPWNQLVHLELDTRLNSLTVDPDPQFQPITLPALHHLHSIRDPKALTNFTTPALHHLVLTTFEDPYRDRRVDHHWTFENVVNLIVRSNCHIQTLQFRVPTYTTSLSHEAVVSVLQVAPDLGQLNFDVAHVQNMNDIQWSQFEHHILGKVDTIVINVSLSLTWDTEDEDEGEQQQQMEFIREVVDTDLKILSDYNRNTESLISMFETLPLLRRVEISHESPVYLTPSVLFRLRQLNKRITLSVLPNVETDPLKRLGQFCTLSRVISLFFITTLLASIVPR